MDSHTSDAISDLKLPSTIIQLESFLELFNVFCRFVPNFAHGVVPLNNKLRRDQLERFQDTTEENAAAIKALHVELVLPIVITLLRHGRKNYLDTDACNVKIGCVLLPE